MPVNLDVIFSEAFKLILGIFKKNRFIMVC